MEKKVNDEMQFLINSMSNKIKLLDRTHDFRMEMYELLKELLKEDERSDFSDGYTEGVNHKIKSLIQKIEEE